MATRRTLRYGSRALTLLETMIAVAILALAAGIITAAISSRLSRNAVDSELHTFARTLRMAAEQAVVRGKDYAVQIDVTDGYYTVWPCTTEGEIPQGIEPLIDEQVMDTIFIDEIEHEDGSHQYGNELILHATPQGWSFSVLMFFLDDREQNERYLRCDRFTSDVTTSVTPLALPEFRYDLP